MTTFPALRDMQHVTEAAKCWCGAAEVAYPGGNVVVFHNDALGIIYRLHPLNLETFAQMGGRGPA